jgi:hypothetical protein
LTQEETPRDNQTLINGRFFLARAAMFKRFGGLPGRFWRRSFLRHLRRHLRARFLADGDALVNAVGRDARAIYEASPKPDPGRKGHMIVNMCSLVLATYRAVQAKTDDGRLAFEIVQQTMETTFRAPVLLMLRIYLRLWRDPVGKFSRMNFAARGRKAYGKSMHFDQEQTADGVDLLVHRCSFHQFFLDHGVPGLTLAVCNWDRNWMDLLNGSARPIRSERPTTISTGGDCCRFRFIRSPETGQHETNDVVLNVLSLGEAGFPLTKQIDSSLKTA